MAVRGLLLLDARRRLLGARRRLLRHMRLLIGSAALLAFSAFSLLGCVVDEQETATPTLAPASTTTPLRSSLSTNVAAEGPYNYPVSVTAPTDPYVTSPQSACLRVVNNLPQPQPVPQHLSQEVCEAIVYRECRYVSEECFTYSAGLFAWCISQSNGCTIMGDAWSDWWGTPPPSPASLTTAAPTTGGAATDGATATSAATTGGACDWLIEYDQLRLTDDGSMPIPDDMSQLGRDYVLQVCDFILEYARRSGDDPEGAAYYDFARSACNADYDYFRKGKQLAEVHHAAGVTLSTETARMLDSYSNIFKHLVNCLRDHQTPEQQEVVRKCAPRALQEIRGYYECLYDEWSD